MADLHQFKNRLHAGKLLAAALTAYARHPSAIILALPRGGVPVGYAVARELALPLDVLLVRKLGLPGHEEYAIGAVGSGGVRVLQEDVVAEYGIAPIVLQDIVIRELLELARRERQFRGGRAPLRLDGKVAIVVDDGLATGSTMRAAVQVARRLGAARVVAAVPVGAPETCAALEREVDELVCLVQPPYFHAVSQWYRRFDQTDDAEVQDLLAKAWRDHAGRHPAYRFTQGDHHETDEGART